MWYSNYIQNYITIFFIKKIALFINYLEKTIFVKDYIITSFLIWCLTYIHLGRQ